MKYWLIKSDPNVYSWQQLEKENITKWDGVRNPIAQSYMKAMKRGDQALFYHSINEKAICGIVEIVKEHYIDNSPKYGQVDVKFVKSLPTRVTLIDIKQNPHLAKMIMVTQQRLTVSPVTENEWDEIIRMSKS